MYRRRAVGGARRAHSLEAARDVAQMRGIKMRDDCTRRRRRARNLRLSCRHTRTHAYLSSPGIQKGSGLEAISQSWRLQRRIPAGNTRWLLFVVDVVVVVVVAPHLGADVSRRGGDKAGSQNISRKMRAEFVCLRALIASRKSERNLWKSSPRSRPTAGRRYSVETRVSLDDTPA